MWVRHRNDAQLTTPTSATRNYYLKVLLARAKHLFLFQYCKIMLVLFNVMYATKNK